jgi:hypothetical protein
MDDYIRRDDALFALRKAERGGSMTALTRLERAYAEIREMPAADVAEVCFPAELHVGDRAWKKAMSILDKKYAEAKKLPFIRDPLAWALYHTWREFDDGKRCD